MDHSKFQQLIREIYGVASRLAGSLLLAFLLLAFFLFVFRSHGVLPIRRRNRLSCVLAPPPMDERPEQLKARRKRHNKASWELRVQKLASSRLNGLCSLKKLRTPLINICCSFCKYSINNSSFFCDISTNLSYVIDESI